MTEAMVDNPRFFTDAEVASALPWGALIESLEAIVVEPAGFSPERTVHTVPDASGRDAAFLLKPGWVVGEVIVVKAVTFFPHNGELDLPTINAGVLLFSGADGTFLGACGGNELTARRTAAASAVAAKRLARGDAKRLLVVGTGALGPMTAQAHAHVRDYESIEIWGRNPDKARVVVAELAAVGLDAVVSEDVDASVALADVITCVTGSTTPVVRGELLQPGTHVDLIGSFTPEMRETDDDVVRRSTVFVDTYADAVLAGDLAQPLASGLLHISDIAADLHELVSGAHPGRRSDAEITMYKSAGFALEDVAAARLVFER